MNVQNSMWLGSEESFTQAFAAEAQIAATPKLELARLSGEIMAQDDSSGEFGGYGHMITRVDNLAIVKIEGPLVTADRPYNRYFGVVSYAEIRNATYAAATHPDVEGVVLHARTPGGAASGISDTGEFIRKVDAQVAPVFTFTDTSMASGGYWLGSFGREIYASNLAMVGSIGVITVHASFADQLKEQGIKVTVIRKGEFKALGSPYEDLDAKALAQIEGQMGAVYDAFLATVSDNRGISVPILLKTAAEGRVFVGGGAVTAGLVDHVEFFDEAINLISKKVTELSSGSGTRIIHTNKGTNIMAITKVLTDAGVAAIAAGAPENEVLKQEGMTAEIDESEVTDAGAEAEVSAEAGEESDPKEVESQVSEAIPASVDMSLIDKVGELQVEIAELKADNTKVTQELALSAVNEGSLVRIAIATANRMQVPLGGLPLKAGDLSTDALIGMHNKITATFDQRFRPGAKAESMTGDDATPASVSNPALDAAAARLVAK